MAHVNCFDNGPVLMTLIYSAHLRVSFTEINLKDPQSISLQINQPTPSLSGGKALIMNVKVAGSEFDSVNALFMFDNNSKVHFIVMSL